MMIYNSTFQPYGGGARVLAAGLHRAGTEAARSRDRGHGRRGQRGAGEYWPLIG